MQAVLSWGAALAYLLCKSGSSLPLGTLHLCQCLGQLVRSLLSGLVMPLCARLQVNKQC